VRHYEGICSPVTSYAHDCSLGKETILTWRTSLDTLESVSSIFADECCMCLETFLSNKFSTLIDDYIKLEESQILPTSSTDIENTTIWNVARPPHKHRFLFQGSTASSLGDNPLLDLLQNLLPSKAFRKWLSLATGHEITSQDSLIRRFRRGMDYTLATSYEEDSPRIELCLSLTPSSGWGDDKSEEITDSKTTPEAHLPGRNEDLSADSNVGGYLAYMAGDEANDSLDDDNGSNHGVEVPLDMSTGARSSRATKPGKVKQDPAIYQSSEEDDGVLFSMPACWNRLAIVLRDKSTMRFVKYVSRMARGDRWDLVGDFEIVDEDSDDDVEDDKANANADTAQGLQDDDATDDDHDDVEEESDSD